MQLNPYLNFNGQCEAAFKFYEKCLGGKITGIFTFGDTPALEHVPSDWHTKIMHVRLEIGDAVLMGSDGPPGQYDVPKGTYVSLHTKDPAKADRIFNALSEDGVI